MPTPTLVGSPTRGGSTSTTTSSVVTSDAGAQVGDRVVVVLVLKGSRTAPTVTPPSGFTQIAGPATGGKFITGTSGGATANVEVYEKVVTVAGAQTGTFSYSGSTTPSWACVVLHSAGGGVVRGSASNAAGNSVTTAAITTTNAAEFVLRFLGGAGPSTGLGTMTTTWDAACTKLTDVQGTGASNDATSFLALGYEVGPTPAGAIASRSISIATTGSANLAASATGAIGFAAPTAPTNTSAPVASGTAAVGSVLTSTGGAWDQTVTTSYQWQRDTVDISGATASTYTVATADAGHSLRCVVTATSSGGATAANSNAVAIPAAPVNTVAPALSRVGGGTTYATGDTVTCSTGTWTGTGLSYTYQWYRGVSPITGETAAAYALVVSDEGANISCRVTAINGGGSATANSNTITPAVTAPLSDASYLNYYSGGTGNTDPALSLGGARGGTWPGAVNDLFGPILGTVAQSGGVFYRLIYVRNTHTLTTADAGIAYVETQFPSGAGMELAVGVPVEAANAAVTAVASGTTAPAGVTFTTGTDTTFGALTPGAWRGLWLRLTVSAGAPKADLGSPDTAGWAIEFS